MTLTIDQIPAHKHTTTFDNKKYFPGGGSTNIGYGGAGGYPADVFSMDNTGGGGSGQAQPPNTFNNNFNSMPTQPDLAQLLMSTVSNQQQILQQQQQQQQQANQQHQQLNQMISPADLMQSLPSGFEVFNPGADSHGVASGSGA